MSSATFCEKAPADGAIACWQRQCLGSRQPDTPAGLICPLWSYFFSNIIERIMPNKYLAYRAVVNLRICSFVMVLKSGVIA